MKRWLWKAGVLLFGILICLLPVKSVEAAEVIPEDQFDYEWYLEQHPDLAAITTEHAVVYQFYLNIGLAADWNGRIAPAYITDETYLKCYAIVDSITNPSMTQRQKAEAIHNWICQNVRYDYSYMHYSISDTINGGYAVCQGYADTFQYMCSVAGIECEVVTGSVTPSIRREVKLSDGRTVYIYAAGDGGHAWNQLKVDGKWYQADVCWDDGYEGLTSEGYLNVYFLITPENMMYDHTYASPERIHY